MDDFPMPQMLDADRMLLNERGNFGTDEFKKERTELLDRGLRETCGYAQDLWTTLDELRRYLLDRLPSDPRAPGSAARVGASPSAPDDEQGWQAWMNAYAAVNSVLAGPAGDSGYGRKEARREAQWRRSAREMTGSSAPAAQPGGPRAGRIALIGTALAAASGFLLGAVVRRTA